MQIEQAKQLLNKYTDGTASEEEIALLEAWYNQYDSNKLGQVSVKDKIDQLEKIRHTINQYSKEESGSKKNPQTLKIWKRIAVAASIVLCIGIGLYFYTSHYAHRHTIPPGTNKAYLTLSSGKRITLTDAANGTIAQQAGMQITKTANGQLVYTLRDPGLRGDDEGGEVNGDRGGRHSDAGQNPGIAQLNTVETPNAGQYQVTLPDGTNIWLNSASTLKYPASFAAQKTRTIQLTGEAYFEVAKDKNHPFIVKTAKQEVTVLGTHFNINSYTDEPATKTTLLEGSVKVGDKVLKPGQQSILKGGTLTVTQADTEEAIAWKAGYFKFQSEPIQSVMRKISRWYDVEIRYEGQMPTQGLWGTVSRYQNVSKVLDMLQATGLVKFRIEGRTIIVSNK